MFVDHLVDIGLHAFAGVAAHHEHAFDDAVGARAVLDDALEVVGYVAGDLVDQLLLFLVGVLAGLAYGVAHFLKHLVDELDRAFGEVLHEIQWVCGFRARRRR